MVGVVVPLGIEPLFQQAGLVGVVFHHEVDAAVRTGRARLAGQPGQPVGAAHGVHGVEPQAVETIFPQPVQRVVDEVALHGLLPIVDGRAPRRVGARVKEVGGVAMEVIAVGPEVVVDHVQHDAHLQAVRRIDEGLQFIGRAVGGVRRVRQHAVVAPVARAGKIRDGHEFEQRDAQARHLGQAAAQAGVAAAQAGMRFVDDAVLPGTAAPPGVAPRIAVGSDHHAVAGPGAPSTMAWA
ncbi:Uncharacterised protein [Bordetella pertussis]|nr:Uncharacterised protein [Bordetella pertussis]